MWIANQSLIWRAERRVILLLTLKLVVPGLLQQELQVTKVVWKDRAASSHVVQNVFEHLSVPAVRNCQTVKQTNTCIPHHSLCRGIHNKILL